MFKALFFYFYLWGLFSLTWLSMLIIENSHEHILDIVRMPVNCKCHHIACPYHHNLFCYGTETARFHVLWGHCTHLWPSYPTSLALAHTHSTASCNNTVFFSVWHDRDMHSAKCYGMLCCYHQENPCQGWMTANETLRDLTSMVSWHFVFIGIC